MSVTNIGILAHVDAGKTSLTERILFEAGILSRIGSVDAGTTRTDTLSLERQRGITIQSAVVSFSIDGQTFNLIDTPGHPDFIAEVDRALRVLDVVILVVSAVEGVQSQTRRLFRAIRDRRIPCLIFANKIDRAGARPDDVVEELRRELSAHPLALTRVIDPGQRDATSERRDFATDPDRDTVIDLLTSMDTPLLREWIERDGDLGDGDIEVAIRRQFTAANLLPVIHGSAITGAGGRELLRMLAELFPGSTPPAPDGPPAAEVFKVHRSPSGERTVICRIWRGTFAAREIVPIARALPSEDVPPARITNLLVYRDGEERRAESATAGEIVRISGLHEARIGDWIGSVPPDRLAIFDPPVFEYRITPVDDAEKHDLLRALSILADEDPLISTRIDERTGMAFVHLYGDIQREVIESTLLDRFRLRVNFGTPAVICVERLRDAGEAAEIWGKTDPPFYATVGFRVRPRQGDRSRWVFTPGKAKKNYYDAAEIGGRSALAEGLYGWPVIDLDVEVTELIYLTAAVPADYRKLATLVMADAVKQAGAVVCEPIYRFVLRAPVDAAGSCTRLLVTNGAEITESQTEETTITFVGSIPATSVREISRSLPGLTGGRADFEARFHEYRPVQGEPPRRHRTDLNPYDRVEYLSHLEGRF